MTQQIHPQIDTHRDRRIHRYLDKYLVGVGAGTGESVIKKLVGDRRTYRPEVRLRPPHFWLACFIAD